MKPLLVLQVPAELLIDPAALRRLALEVGDQFNARLKVETMDWPARGSRIRLVGDWDLTPMDVWALLADLVQQAFVVDPLESQSVA